MKESTISTVIFSAACVSPRHIWMPPTHSLANLPAQTLPIHHYTPEARSC